MKADRFGSRALCKNEFSSYIVILADNTSANSAINKMGRVNSIEIDNQVHYLWELIITQKHLLIAKHIPGVFNEDADRESRKQELRTELMLNQRDFHYVTKKLSFHQFSLHQLTCWHQNLILNCLNLYLID